VAGRAGSSGPGCGAGGERGLVRDWYIQMSGTFF
jgi:hypothetical protein